MDQLKVAKFINGQRNCRFLLDDNNFEYKVNRTDGRTTFWKCRRSYAEKCYARAVTVNVEDSEYLKCVSGNHTHSSKLKKKRVSDVESEYIKNAANNPTVPPRAVLGELTNVAVRLL